MKILDDGQELDNLSSEQIRILVDNGVIYFCDEPDCQCYHIQPGENWSRVQEILDAEEYKTQKRISD